MVSKKFVLRYLMLSGLLALISINNKCNFYGSLVFVIVI